MNHRREKTTNKKYLDENMNDSDDLEDEKIKLLSRFIHFDLKTMSKRFHKSPSSSETKRFLMNYFQKKNLKEYPEFSSIYLFSFHSFVVFEIFVCAPPKVLIDRCVTSACD